MAAEKSLWEEKKANWIGLVVVAITLIGSWTQMNSRISIAEAQLQHVKEVQDERADIIKVVYQIQEAVNNIQRDISEIKQAQKELEQKIAQ